MAVSEVSALIREFCMTEIGTWGNDDGKRVWLLKGGEKIRFYCILKNSLQKSY